MEKEEIELEDLDTPIEEEDDNSEHERKEHEDKLVRLVKNTIEYYEKYIFPEAYEIIKSKVLFSWDLKALLISTWNEHRSCNVYPLIASVHDTFFSNTFDILPVMRAVAQNPEDIDKTEKAQDFIDWARHAWNATYSNEEMLSEATLLWCSSGQVSFNKDDCTITYMKWETEVEETNENAIPWLEHVPFFEMFIDYNWNDFYKNRYKFRRKIKSWDSITSTYTFIDDLENKAKAILEWKKYISQCDYNKIWEIKHYTTQYTEAIKKSLKWVWTDSSTINIDSIVYNNMFQIDFKDELVEVIEHWSNNELSILMNWNLVYKWKSPYPISKDPFVHLYLEKLPWSIRCRGIWHKLMSHQKQVNTHWNACQDAINMHLRPMYIVEKDILVWHDWKSPKKITWKDWATLVSKQPWIQNGGIRALEFVDFNMVQISRDMIKNLLMEAQEIVWTNSYTQWGQWKVERSPTAVRARTAITSSRLQQLISSMNKLHQKTFEFWLAMATTFKDEEFNVRIYKEDTWEVFHNTVKPTDIINKFDILVENENDRLATKQERLWQVIQLLQILTPYITEQVAEGVIVSKIDINDLILQVLNSLDYKWLKQEDMEWMKEQIKEKVDLALYHQSLIWWQAPVEWEPTGMPSAEWMPTEWLTQAPWEDIGTFVDKWWVPNFDYTMPEL